MLQDKKKKLPEGEFQAQEQQPESQPQQAARQPTNEEQMQRRQSAPRPTLQQAMEAAVQEKMQQQQSMPTGQGGQPAMNGKPAMNGFKAVKQVIGREQILKAQQTLLKYKEGKANLEQRIIENEQWYKLRHWECMRKEQKQNVEPTSAHLLNCILNKHADAMDNFPSPNVLPREEGDKAEAERLTSIIPVVLDQCEFEETYSDVQNYKLKTGTGVYFVYWDKSKLNGLGDIGIRKADILNLFWESGITDIQKSRNLFHVELMDNDLLLGQYPQLSGKLSTSSVNISKYIYDDNVDTNNKSVVVDWYYKKMNRQGKTVLHYCKYVNDVVLFASENETQPVMDNMGNPIGEPMCERGWYDHGQYPFIFDVLYPTEGTPCGFGFIDIGKNAQEFIDRGNQAVMKNMLANASPRYFISNSGAVNEEEFANLNNELIHVDGQLSQDSIIPVHPNTLNNIYVEVLNNKIEELKETTGNRDVSTGGSTGGVTAASAIAAMQESGSKLSRDNNKASYRAFRKLCLMVIELIRQFYDLPRCFRIMGENGMQRFIQYSNAGIMPQHQGNDFGQDMGYRLPLFDVEVSAEKQSPYSKMSQNELALQFYTAGFFNPQAADQALACLDMMDFNRKQFVMKKIAENGTMLQQLMMAQQQVLQLASIIDGQNKTNYAQQFAQQQQMQAMGGMPMMGGMPASVEETEALGGKGSGEASNTKKARQRVAESTSPV